MKMCITTSALAVASALSAAAAFAALPDGWTDDFDAAKRQAADEGKRLLVDFSGSETFAQQLSEIKGEIEAARSKAPASVKKDLDNLAKPLELMGGKKAKGK